MNTSDKTVNRKTITLSNGLVIPRMGQGSWHMGENPKLHDTEIASLRRGLEMGLTMIDTAEMYGSGHCERLVGEAITGIKREKLTLISKIIPKDANEIDIKRKCEGSLKRLGVDYLDIYLLHWRGGVPLYEVAEGMQRLVDRGFIRAWGVSNFDFDDMRDLWDAPLGNNCVTNQVLYHLGSRGPEYSLIPWHREHKVATMAYCPLAQGGHLKPTIFANSTVAEIAEEHNAAPAQILLAFLMSQEGVVAIPKTNNPDHARQNAMAALIDLDQEEITALGRAFPAPRRKLPLEML